MTTVDVDVLVIGAGLSGIGMAATLKRECPERSFLLLEARAALGGTWDLFRYPGIRSDSDMFTLGFSAHPWRGAKAIADGGDILAYLQQVARETGVDKDIRYNARAVAARWSSETATWTVTLDGGDEVTCRWMHSASGYYRYDEGYTPEFPGREAFGGTVVHPQHWPADLDYAGKRVVVIGSGATAVTLVPSLAEKAAHVVMLQRSPTYIVSRPGVDKVADVLRKRLSPTKAHTAIKWKSVALTGLSFAAARKWPEPTKKLLRKGIEQQLPAGYDIDTHFTPSYNPWDQRLCLVPDGDLFKAIRHGSAEVVTDTIRTFDETGIQLNSGRHLAADIIVTATGLNILMLGGLALTVDGEDVKVPERVAYRGLMASDVPNFSFTIGYTNASWTLKADLVADWVARVLNHMKATGSTKVFAPSPDASEERLPLLDFSSGYVQRALDALPKQGTHVPWRVHQNYARDVKLFRKNALEDGVLEFSR